MSQTAPRLAVVLPVYNEAPGIARLFREIEEIAPCPLELVAVDDGSEDGSLKAIEEYRPVKAGNRKKVVALSRNFGHQNALMAGLHHVSDDCRLILVMDADFQDDPRDIPRLLAKLDEGYDCVYAVRKSRGDSWLISALARLFHRLQQGMAVFSIPLDAGTFSVFHRKVLHKILELEEREIYFPGLRAYVGYRQVGLPARRQSRAYGKSRVGFWRLVNLSVAGLLGFSEMPMRLILVLGLALTLFCGFIGLLIFVLKLVGFIYFPGVTTVLLVMVGLSGIQIMFIGLVGEYIGKLFLESKGRPRWIVKEVEREPAPDEPGEPQDSREE